MMLNTYILFVLTIVNSFGVIKTYNAYNKTDIGSFHRFTMSNELLFVGGERGIVALWKSNLSASNIKNNESRNIWLILYNKGKNTVTECSQLNDTTSSCRKLDSTLSNLLHFCQFGINKTDSSAYVQTEVLDSSAQSTTVLVLSATSIRYETKTYGIITLDLDNFTIFDTNQNSHGPMNLEIGPKFDIVFKSVISLDSSVFFFFEVYDRDTITFKKSRVGKLCKKRKGGKKMDGYYHSYEDIGLKCKVSDKTFEMVERAILVNNKTFLVIFKDGQKHAVCTFSLKSIINKMISERQDQLECNYTKYGSYFKPNLQVKDTQCFKNGDGKGDDKHEVVSHYSTLWDGASLESNGSIYDCAQQLTAIAVKSMKDSNTSIIYVGTDNGSLIMMHVNANDGNHLIKDISTKQVHVSSSRIDDILIDDQSGIYLLAKDEIIKIGYSDCKNLTTCKDSVNLYCDWIDKAEGFVQQNFFEGSFLVEGKELRRETTDTNDDSSTNDLNIQPERFLIDKIVKPADTFYIKYTPERQANCTVIGVNISWTTARNYSLCTGNLSQDHITPGNYTFSFLQDGAYVANKTIEFYTCGQYKSCLNCLPNEGCHWNHGFGKCRQYNYNEYTLDNCPVIGKNDNSITQIYANKQNVTVNVPFLIDTKQLPVLYCETTNGTNTTTSKADFDKKSFNATCYNLSFIDKDFSENSIYTIRLLYGDDKNATYVDGSIKIEVYTCKSNLTKNDDCSKCKGQDYEVSCNWCNSSNSCYSDELNETCDLPAYICPVRLKEVLPTSGPGNGGTVVTIKGMNFIEDINMISVLFEQADCKVLPRGYSSEELRCETSNVTRLGAINNINIIVNGTPFSKYNGTPGWFTYKKPQLEGFYPNSSIQSGGRSIYLNGTDIGFYGDNRYNIQFCYLKECVKCRYVKTVNNTVINCLSGNITTPSVLNKLEVVIDNKTTLQLNQTLTYVKDPSGFELSNETASVQQSGGPKISINGNGFSEVGHVTIDRVEKPCHIESDNLVECETPEYSGNSTFTGKVSETVNVHFDGLKVPITIDYVGDPMFEKYQDIIEYEKGASIDIKGRNIIAGARWNDYTIYVGKTGSCYTEKEYVTDTNIKCWPPQHVPLTNYTDQSLVYVHVKVGRLRIHIGVLKYIEETNYLVIVISILAAALVIAVGMGVGVTLRMRKKRKKAEKKFIFELQSVEERVRTNSREEFAETQIAIGDIQSDLVTSKVPYRDYQTYILLQLFPNQDPHSNSLLLDLQVSNEGNGKYKEAVEKLELLLQNKIFLKSLVQSLERPNTLTVREKAEFAALLSIALMGKMRLFYDLVHCVLTDSIRSVTKRQQRGLFRRLDSITCRMMTHWLQIVLFKQLQGQSGLQLFILLKAVQTVMERGPVDAVTGHCKNTLCEEKLLKLRVDCAQYILNIDLNGNPDHCYQVKVLECDTISQVKRKCCAQIYKNKPASEIPKFEELELEWKEGQSGKLLLQDIDQTSERTDGHVRLNTLTHYKVRNDCRMSLLYGVQQDDVYANLARQTESASFEDVNLLMPDDPEKDENLQKWHLSTTHVGEGPNLERDIGDIYLNRLFHTKLLLSKYIDSMFDGLLDPECVSLPISYFIQTLEKLAKTNSVDPEVLQIWKNECYATRIWAPLIGKPQAAFDIHVPEHTEPVMDILSQVFVECLTQSTFRVSKESPTQRLLFHKDIERYRKAIPTFYNHMEPIADHDFWRTLDQLSDMQKEDVKFSRQSTIHQLYNLFIAKYRDKIVMDMEDMEESNGLQLGRKLEEIFELMND